MCPRFTEGRPLKIGGNPNASPEMEAAYRLLKDNGYLLPWMEKGRQIDRIQDVGRITDPARTLEE